MTDVVKDVKHEGSVAGAHFVNDEVVIGVESELVVGHHVSCNGLSVVGAKQLGRRVPQLSGLVEFFRIQFILKPRVPLSQQSVELRLVPNRSKVKGSSGGEDGDVFAEISILRVVQRILDKVSHQHLDPPRTFRTPSQLIGGDGGKPLELVRSVRGEVVGPLLPRTLHRRLDGEWG